MTACCALLVLLAALPKADWGTFLAKLEVANRRDEKALLDLGAWCEDAKLLSGASLCYGRVLKLSNGAASQEAWAEASYRLSRIEIESGRHEKAYARLRDLVSRQSHAEARELLRKAETAQTREQLKHFEKGKEFLEKGSHKQALESLEQAYQLLPERTTDAAYVPRGAVLAELARCRAKIDDRYYQAHVKRERSVEPCPVCSGTDTPGFLTCTAVPCNGRGKWKVRRFKQGVGWYYETLTCNDCTGHGYLGCGHCSGLGRISEVMTRAEKDALLKVVNRVRHPQVFKRSIDAAIKVVEDVLLGVKEGSTLNYLRAIQQSYTISEPVRKALLSVPPDPESTRRAQAAWAAPKLQDRARVNFLLSYACEYSGYLHHFEMLRGVRKPKLPQSDWASLAAGEPLTPELLSAFPDEDKVEWKAVKGFLGDRGAKEKASESPYREILEVQGEIPHDVSFFVWLPSARPRLEALGASKWKDFIGDLANRYPFELSDKIRVVPRDHEVVLVGRFLRNRLGYPRNWFEVWHFEVGLSRAQEESRRVLGETIDEISFSGIPMARVAQFLRDWRDLEVRFDGVSDSKAVSCDARACPLGLLVDRLARAVLGCEWYCDKGKVVVFCRTAPREAALDTEAVLRVLDRSPGEIRVSESTAPQEVATAPEDPAELRRLASQEIRNMNYDRAALCLEKLGTLPASGGEKSRKDLSRARQTAGLFGYLTRRTPVSHLVGATDLVEVIYKKAEAESPRTVSVLRRDPGSWLVEEAYGVRFTLDPTTFPKEPKRVEPAEWRARKEQELARLEGESEKASPEARVSKLFLLSIFAKTHGFPEKGTEYLKRAISLPEFELFLAAHAPADYDALAAVWREATGKASAADATVPATAPPEPVSERRPSRESEAATRIAMAPVEPLPEGLSGAALLARIREYARQGHSSYQRVLEGENAGGWRKQAQAYFQEAARGAQRYLAAQPDDAEARKLLATITQLERDILKDMSFFD